MTAPSTNKTAAKSTSAKATPPVVEKREDNAVVTTPDVVQENTSAETPEETPVERMPSALAENNILSDFAQRYLDIFDEIMDYNKIVLAERDAEWTTGKVLEKARDFARPTEKDKKPVADVKTALEAYENLVNELAKARRNVLDVTAKELGINLSVTAERDAETEAPLKEKRKLAVQIGTQLSMIAEMTTDKAASSAVQEFLSKNALPAIGRDQVRSFGNDAGKATPKYRVTVTVTNSDSEKLFEAAGFTKASLLLPKYSERGKALKSEDLRKAWEAAGNNSEQTVKSPVEFVHEGLHFSIAKNN